MTSINALSNGCQFYRIPESRKSDRLNDCTMALCGNKAAHALASENWFDCCVLAFQV